MGYCFFIGGRIAEAGDCILRGHRTADVGNFLITGGIAYLVLNTRYYSSHTHNPIIQ